jgi:polysaccharide export outer membrane protein
MKLRLLLFFTTAYLLVLSVPGQSPITEAPKGYLIGPGDVIAVKALGEKEFDVEAITVDDDGKIQIPFVEEPIMASCKTERELQADVAKRWSKFLKNPQVNLHVTARNSRPPVSVIGEVGQNQQYTLTRRVRLLEMLSLAGGPTAKNSGTIQLIRTRPPICADATAMDVWKKETGGLGVATRIYHLDAVTQGVDEANPEILPGDIISVPKAAPIYITGEVRKPGELELPAGGLPLTQAIAMASGSTVDAKIKDIKIYRRRPGANQPEVLLANLDAIKKGTENDLMLQPYDIVEVGKQGETFGSVMTKMLIGLPGRIPIPIP